MWQPLRRTKPRLIVLTDISSLESGVREPDDGQSMIRLMHYANEIDIEGLVAGSNMGHGQVCRPELIHAVVDAYAKDQPGLAKHAAFPKADELRAVVFGGQPIAGPKVAVEDSIGAGKETDASRHLIACVDRDDPRPVWIAVWGGTADLAQALWTVEHERSKEDLDRFVAKLRVHSIGDQDSTGAWIKQRYPSLMYITRTFGYRGMYRGGDTSLFDGAWVNHVPHGSGSALGALYPNYAGGDIWSNKFGQVHGLKEGDSPSYLNLIDNGLSDCTSAEWNPTWGGWGGKMKGSAYRWECDAADGSPTKDDPDPRIASVYQWRPAFQADFASRLKWAVSPPDHMLYSPLIRLESHTHDAVVGKPLVLIASVEREAAVKSWIERGHADLEDPSTRQPTITPKSPGEIHLIIQATENGLSRYARAVINAR